MRYSALVVAALAALSLTSAAQAQNLVTNGDFESGNTGFASGYDYTPGGNSDEGQYTVRNNPYPWNGAFVSIGDHTSGTGQMYVGNGSSTAGDWVWQSGAITIDTNTDYFFEAFVANVCCYVGYPGDNSAPILDFTISLDGGPAMLLATKTIPLSPAGVWYGLSTSFNSGGATSAVLSLVNANTAPGGNDFAVDDIFLGTNSTVLPEPATWATMIMGFGAVGALLRRRRGLAFG